MKRTISITLAVLAAACLFRASHLVGPAHAQSENARGPVIHPLNPHADGAGVANSVEEPCAPELDHGQPRWATP